MRAPLASDGSFSLLVYERYQRVKKSLYLALVETYRIGVAICKIKSIAEELSGDRIPRSTISAGAVIWIRSFLITLSNRNSEIGWKRTSKVALQSLSCLRDTAGG
jgi:hypothetical protein